MKTKLKLSPLTAVMLVLLVVMVSYFFLGFLPDQTELNLIRTDITVLNAEANMYRPYLNNTKPLEEQLDKIQAEIDSMNANDYTNDSTVSMVLGDAIQKNNVSLTSLTLGETTNVNGNRALPLNISLTGSLNNVTAFIRFFENNTEGSYLVHSATVEIVGDRTTANMVIYLCTPAV